MTYKPEDQVGAPGSLTLGGRTFLVSAATDEMMMIVLRHLRKHVPSPLDMYAQVAAHPAFAVLPEETRRALAEEAARKALAGGGEVPGEVYTDLLLAAPGCRFLAWVLLRDHQPNLTLESLTPLITDENAPVVFMQLQRESGMEALGKGR